MAHDLDDEELEATRRLNGVAKTTADKMFEELGYSKQQVCNPLTGEEYLHDHEYVKWDGTWEEHILINNSTKLIHMSSLLFGRETGKILTKEKLQAINKKCKELGWLDE